MIAARPQAGFAMLEALISIVVLAIGILGLGGLLAHLQRADTDTYARTQALVLLDDMAARISAHRIDAPSYVTTAPVGTGDGEPADCTAFAVGSARDTCEWSALLKGASERLGTANAGAMTAARGCVTAVPDSSPPAYVIAVAWKGLTATVAPSITCGAADATQHVVAKTIAFANLAP